MSEIYEFPLANYEYTVSEMLTEKKIIRVTISFYIFLINLLRCHKLQAR
jgi:hypothetical protein